MKVVACRAKARHGSEEKIGDDRGYVHTVVGVGVEDVLVAVTKINIVYECAHGRIIRIEVAVVTKIEISQIGQIRNLIWNRSIEMVMP